MNKKILTIFLFVASSLSFSYSETDVKKLKFTGVCEDCDFSGLVFSKDDFGEIVEISFGKSISTIDLTDKNLNGSNFKGANLSNVNLSRSTLVRTNFEDANLSGAEIRSVNLSEANFKNANLSRAKFSSVKTVNANFMFANLSNINMTRANLFRVDFRGANFTGTKLVNANLKDADFTGAIFRNANISGALVYGANFTAVDLSQTEMQKVSFEKVILCGTIMPWGIEDSGCTTIEKPKTDMDDFDL